MILQTIHVPEIRGELAIYHNLSILHLLINCSSQTKGFLRPEVTYQNDSPQDIYIVERRADMINPIWIKAMKK